MEVGNPGKTGCRRLEECVLVVGEGVVRFIGVRHVRREAFDFEVGKLAERFGERHGGLEFEAEAMEAGIDFDVDARVGLRSRGGFGEGLAEFERIAGKGEAGANGGHGIGGKSVAEDEDWAGDSGLAEHVALVWPHDRKPVDACSLQGGGEHRGAGPVGVRLYDGDEFRGAEHGFQAADVVGRRIQVDFDPGVFVGCGLGEGFVGNSQLRHRRTLSFPTPNHALPGDPSKPSIRDVLGARNRRLARWRVWVAAAACVAALPGCVFGGSENGEKPPPPFQGEVEHPTATAGASATPTTPVAPGTAIAGSGSLAAANEMFREGRFGEARAAYAVIAGASLSGSERAEALVGMSNAALQLNDEAVGLGALEQAVEAAPASSVIAVRAGYLLVRAYNQAGRYADAAALYRNRAGAASNSPLYPYEMAEGAFALAMSGEPVQASAVWERVLGLPQASPAFRVSVYRAQAAAARGNDDDLALRVALTALVGATGEPGARIELSEVAGRSGDYGMMVAQQQAIVAQSPASVYATIALQRLKDEGHFVDAGQEGLVHYRRGAYTQAIDVLTAGLSAEGLSAGDRAFRAFYLGASYEDAGRAADAIRAYDIAAGSGANSPYVHRAKYWAARVAESDDQPREASRRYQALVTDGPPGEFTQEAAFRAGYVLFKAGDTAGALATWDAVTVASSARLEYWRGRALAGSGQVAAASQAYHAAVAFGPYDLHGLEAARELGEGVSLDVRYRERDLGATVDWSAIEAWLKARIGGGPVTREPTAACELAAAGLRSPAEEELRSADAVATTWGSYALMKEAYGCGLTSVAASMAVNLRVEAGASSSEPPRDLLRISYPVDYAATLNREAKEANVDPLFFAALVRQESFWDPSAGSVAGALGLTQVIPQTGRAIAEQLGVAEFEASDLFRPAVSLEFGAYYLGGELRGYDSPLLALAAYNAGPGPAARWASAGDRRAADLVETIDYTETRNYVTYIYEAYAHYLLAWGP